MQRRIVRAGTFALALVALSLAPSAQTPSPLFTQGGSIPVLDSYLEALRQQAGIPGMAAIVLKDGEPVWEKGYGFANTATRERVNPDTPFMVGDISGTLAATLLLQCVELRRVGLDEPFFSRYQLSAPEPTATLRGLLSHASPEPVRGVEPFTYSPERYSHLTALMEWCAPQPYRKSVSHRILEHLAMRDSVPGRDLQNPNVVPEGLYDPSHLERYARVLERLAVPYKVDKKGRATRTELPVEGINAAVGLVSTARDLARFDSALDTSLLLDETRALAWTNAPSAGFSSATAPTGLGWFVQSYRGERVVWHFGLIPNAYSSLIIKLPSRHMTVILLANSDGLTGPFSLQAGDVTRSVFANLILRLFLS
jgi:CubicO group peptidase (beta-lactamase class C family)